MALREGFERFLNSDSAGLASSPLSWLLAPLAILNAKIQYLRREGYRKGDCKSVHPGVPTVCVGNITLGGTGQTPLVEEVCALFTSLGLKPAVISRGYGGELEGSAAVVSDGEEVFLNAAQAGDEPVLLARRLTGVPVVIAAKRIDGARLAVDKLGAQALVMDDGYQHLKLARDLDIVVLDATRPFGNGFCLPRGMLREPPTALCDAGALILTRSDRLDRVELDRVEAQLRRYNSDAPILCANHRMDRVVGWPVEDCGESDELRWLKGRKLLAFAGIGKPEAFFGQLEELGAELVGRASYSDHHAYTVADLQGLVRQCGEGGGEALVTTEKDAVRLMEYLPLGVPLKVVTLRVELTETDREALRTLIGSVTESYR
jgi:tetraacyldisaccharide 4'-kinase